MVVGRHRRGEAQQQGGAREDGCRERHWGEARCKEGRGKTATGIGTRRKLRSRKGQGKMVAGRNQKGKAQQHGGAREDSDNEKMMVGRGAGGELSNMKGQGKTATGSSDRGKIVIERCRGSSVARRGEGRQQQGALAGGSLAVGRGTRG